MNYAEFGKGLIFKGNLTAVKKIVIHNSATSASAEANAKANYNATTKGQRSAFAHYYVDDSNVVMLARETWIAYHSGNKTMNENSIGIEICVNPMVCLNDCHTDVCSEKCRTANAQLQKFFKAEQNAIDLVHTLLAKWSLTPEDVIFHSDVKKTECPYFTKKLHNLSRGSDFLTIFENPNC